MSAITHGMNIEAVRQLAGQMNQRADEIRSLLASMSAACGGTAWTGSRPRPAEPFERGLPTDVTERMCSMRTLVQAKEEISPLLGEDPTPASSMCGEPTAAHGRSGDHCGIGQELR